MTKGQGRITDGGFPVNPESTRPPQGLVSGDPGSRRTVFTDEGITGDWNIQEIGAAMKGRASVGQTGGRPDVNSARIQCNRDAQIRGILGLRLGVGSQEIVGVQAAFGKLMTEQQRMVIARGARQSGKKHPLTHGHPFKINGVIGLDD